VIGSPDMNLNTRYKQVKMRQSEMKDTERLRGMKRERESNSASLTRAGKL